MSVPHPTAQPASSSPLPTPHQNLTNGIKPLTTHVDSPLPTVTIAPSHLLSAGTTSPELQTPAPSTRPSGTVATMTGQQHSQPRPLTGSLTAASFASRLGELDDGTAAYIRELIESVEVERIGGGALGVEGSGESA